MDEKARLQYIRPLPIFEKERPYHIFAPITKGSKRTNIEYETGPEQVIVDIRGREAEYGLGTHGFEFQSWVPPSLDWGIESDIMEKYVPAVKSLIVEMLDEDVKRCELFDWRMRDTASTRTTFRPIDSDRMLKVKAAHHVHVDQSPSGIVDRLYRQFGDEASDLIDRYHLQIYNVWKPLVDIVEDEPLAVCDARTACQADMIEIDSVSEDYTRRSFMVKYNDSFRFYYLNQMTKEEACIFRVFDSAKVGGQGVPHAAFTHTNPGATFRKSIEVRVVVFSEPRH